MTGISGELEQDVTFPFSRLMHDSGDTESQLDIAEEVHSSVVTAFNFSYIICRNSQNTTILFVMNVGASNPFDPESVCVCSTGLSLLTVASIFQ